MNSGLVPLTGGWKARTRPDYFPGSYRFFEPKRTFVFLGRIEILNGNGHFVFCVESKKRTETDISENDYGGWGATPEPG
jgi:hypothetical protein